MRRFPQPAGTGHPQNSPPEVPGGLMLRMPGFQCHGLGSISDQESEISDKQWVQKNKNKKTAHRGHADRIAVPQWRTQGTLPQRSGCS